MYFGVIRDGRATFVDGDEAARREGPFGERTFVRELLSQTFTWGSIELEPSIFLLDLSSGHWDVSATVPSRLNYLQPNCLKDITGLTVVV
jgi:hypothetical protein